MTIDNFQSGTVLKSVQRISSEKQRGHVLPRPPLLDLNHVGRLRCAHVLALCSISHSTLYSRMHHGTFPRPDGNDGRNYWNTETLKDYLELGE